MNQLIAHLMENLILDFQGELDLEMVREFLKSDETKVAKSIYARIVADGGVDDMLVVLADCLKEYLREGISENVVREQLQLYVES